ncbi:winged helix DNA-binding protein [Pseudonocardia aurantiaca]|uniref:Winged helix DNA-binding protein n=1 Tax=Pseudonocardia aurantiaca TaxID=75290 RepID=A0ABW4FTP8_9PSEU
MASTLARMERDGLVERVPDPHDRRRSLVHLTPRAARSKTSSSRPHRRATPRPPPASPPPSWRRSSPRRPR